MSRRIAWKRPEPSGRSRSRLRSRFQSRDRENCEKIG